MAGLPPGDFDYDAEALLSAIVGVRAELATGDHRPLYLTWLAAYGAWERDEDDDLEPPVPPGLGMLTAAQRALADFLRLDDDLLTIAAQTSPPLEQIADDPGDSPPGRATHHGTAERSRTISVPRPLAKSV